MTDKHIKEDIKNINKGNKEYIVENNRITKNIIDGIDVSGCKFFNMNDETCRELNGKYDIVQNCFFDKCMYFECYYKQLQREKQKLNKIRKVCNKFTPDNYKILLIMNGGIVDE